MSRGIDDVTLTSVSWVAWSRWFTSTSQRTSSSRSPSAPWGWSACSCWTWATTVWPTCRRTWTGERRHGRAHTWTVWTGNRANLYQRHQSECCVPAGWSSWSLCSSTRTTWRTSLSASATSPRSRWSWSAVTSSTASPPNCAATPTSSTQTHLLRQRHKQNSTRSVGWRQVETSSGRKEKLKTSGPRVEPCGTPHPSCVF